MAYKPKEIELPDFLREEDNKIYTGVHGGEEVTEEWNEWLNKHLKTHIDIDSIGYNGIPNTVSINGYEYKRVEKCECTYEELLNGNRIRVITCDKCKK